MKATLVPQTPKPEGVPLSEVPPRSISVVVHTGDSTCWSVDDVVWRAGSEEKIWNFRSQTYRRFDGGSTCLVRILQPGEQVLIEV